jgi:NRPS condensation-like uncharacterized protein
VGDGRALQEYIYLLLETYNHLNDNPAYLPEPNVTGSRSMKQLLDVFWAPREMAHLATSSQENSSDEAVG